MMWIINIRDYLKYCWNKSLLNVFCVCLKHSVDNLPAASVYTSETTLTASVSGATDVTGTKIPAASGGAVWVGRSKSSCLWLIVVLCSSPRKITSFLATDALSSIEEFCDAVGVLCGFVTHSWLKNHKPIKAQEGCLFGLTNKQHISRSSGVWLLMWSLYC